MHVNALLTRRDVKLADIGQVLFFAFKCLEMKARFIKTEKGKRLISSHVDQISLVSKGFII